MTASQFVGCIACQRLEQHLGEAVRAYATTKREEVTKRSDLEIAIRIRLRMLLNHQRSNCPNREYYAGTVRIAELEKVSTSWTAKETIANPPDITVSAVRLEFVGILPGWGKPVYVVHKEESR